MINNDAYQIYIFDTETTGFNPEIHEIIELSAIRLTSQLDGSFTREQKTWYLRSLSSETIQQEALAVNGHRLADILWQTEVGRAKYKEPSEVVVDIERWILDDNVSALDRIFAGQNPKFDLDFCQSLWKRQGALDSFPFALGNERRLLDTQQIVLLIDICTGKRRLNYNLGSLVKSFEVKKGKAHQAEEDTRMTADLLEKTVMGIAPAIREKFMDAYRGDG